MSGSGKRSIKQSAIALMFCEYAAEDKHNAAMRAKIIFFILFVASWHKLLINSRKYSKLQIV